MALDIKSLTPEDIETLRGLIGNANINEQMRTGRRKILTDLRAPSTAAGRLYRPHFEWSADDPGGQVIPPFPRLYWDENGVEGRFESQADMDARMQENWTLLPPNQVPLTKQQMIDRELASLSPEDRDFLLDAQKKARIGRLQDLMSGMSAADVNAAIGIDKPKGKKA